MKKYNVTLEFKGSKNDPIVFTKLLGDEEIARFTDDIFDTGLCRYTDDDDKTCWIRTNNLNTVTLTEVL